MGACSVWYPVYRSWNTQNSEVHTSSVVRYPDNFFTIGSSAHVFVCASHTTPRLKIRAFRMYFLCSMQTGQPISFFPIAVLCKGTEKKVGTTELQRTVSSEVIANVGRRYIHCDELILQFWFGDDIHLYCIKKLP